MVGILVAVVSLCAPALVIAAPAGADSIGSTQDQLTALEAQVSAGATRIHTLTMAYDQANLESSALSQEVLADELQIGHLQQKVSGSKVALQRQAILSYTGGATPEFGAPMTGSSDPSVRAEYLQVAAGDIAQAVDQYRTQEDQMATAESNLARQERQSQAAASAVDSARQSALNQAAAEQAELQVLEGRLNQLVEAAAIASQERAAPVTQGLPVGNGLVAVVQTLVAPSSPYGPGNAGGEWLQLRECESGDNYRADTGNGYYGAYQFSESTWSDLGFPGRPDLESPGMQDAAAMKLQQEAGWGQWPACSAALGLH